MALTHPTPRPSVPLSRRKIHPGLCLAAGFGFIIGTALLVHLVFNLVV